MIPFRVNISQGSVSFPFSPASARQLKSEIALLLDRFQSRSTGNQLPLPSLDYRHAGDAFIEVFCNPNIYQGAFSAKVLLTVRDDRLRLTAETELTRLIEDLEIYLEQND